MANNKLYDESVSLKATYDVFVAYNKAKEVVMSSGYEREIDWQSNIEIDSVGESDFLQEYAWVVLSSGMKESVIRRIFGRFSSAFCEWQSSLIISQHSNRCRESALRVFNNRRKVDGIIKTAQFIATVGFDEFRESLKKDTIKALLSLDFIGPITCYHLAKNIGLNVAKPDRHLKRIAQIFGYTDVQELCKEVSQSTGDKMSVVDLVFWRFAVITPEYRYVLMDYSRNQN